MRFRPPSLGFVYLAGTICCFGAFFAYITRPMWWETGSQKQRKLAEAAYLERIVEGGPEAQRGQWLSDALRLFVDGQDLAAVERVLAKAAELGVSLDAGVLVQVLPEICWIIGTGSERELRPGKSAAIYLRNDSAHEKVLRLSWQSRLDGEGSVRLLGQEWRRFALKAGEEAVVEQAVPPNGVLVLEAKGSLQAANETESQLGLRLVRAEVRS